MQYDKIILKIIEAQEAVIGNASIAQANTVEGLQVSKDKTVELQRDGAAVVNDLVGAYKRLFGEIAVEVCREAAHEAQPGLKEELLPESLRM